MGRRAPCLDCAPKAIGRNRSTATPLCVLVLFILMTAVTAVPVASATVAAPTRIVSMNVCTDQLTLMLAPRPHIQSLSHLVADDGISVSADRIAGISLNHGRSEEILPMYPDLIIAGRYTSRPTVMLLTELGYPLIELDISRSIADIRERVRELGAPSVRPNVPMRSSPTWTHAWLAWRPNRENADRPPPTTSPTDTPPVTILWLAMSWPTPASIT